MTHGSRFLLSFAALAAALSACAEEPRIPSVIMDGAFDEWAETPPSVADPADAPVGVAVDLGSIHVLDDPRYVYFAIETGRTVNAQAMRGTVRVALDADGDPTTGAERLGLPGAELVVLLSRVPDGRTVGEGMAIVPVGADGNDLPAVSANDLGVMAAPTHSANRFEVRVARGRPIVPGGPALLAGESMAATLAFADEAGEHDRTDPFAHRFLTEAVYGPPIRSNRFLEAARGSLRVVQWNVASERFRQNAMGFARVLGALEPDVILLDEVYGDVSPAELEDFFTLPALAPRGPWTFALGEGGGRQKSVVASRLELRPEGTLGRIEYPADSITALRDEFPDSAVARALELEARISLSAAGAWVNYDGTEVLFGAVDFQSRGHDGSYFDRLREVQATMVRSAVREVARGAPVVLGGDLNLVGSRRPLERLAARLDGEEDLVAAPALRLLDRSYATWRSARVVDFTPGRLDFVLVPSTRFDVDRAFVFDAEDVKDGLLESLGINRDDNRTTSDHLPVVVDLLPATPSPTP